MNNKRKLIIGFTALLAFLMVIPAASAVAYTWNGVGGLCFAPTDWLPFTGGVPTMPGDSTTFDLTSNVPPMTCGISGYDSETLAASYGSLVEHTANLVLLNGGLSVDNSQWTLDGGREAHMGQFITQCTTGCPILAAKITLQPAAYFESGGEPLNCTIGAGSSFSIEAGAALNCTSGMMIENTGALASNGFITVASALDLHGAINCGLIAPSACTFETLRGSSTGNLMNTQPATLITIQNTDYAGTIDFSNADLTHIASFVSEGVTKFTGGTSNFMAFADIDIAYFAGGATVNVGGSYLNFSGVANITEATIIDVPGGLIEFNDASNITDSTVTAGAGYFHLNAFSNITNSTLTSMSSGLHIASPVAFHNSFIETNHFSSSAGGNWVGLTLNTQSANISGGTGLNITDSDFNITGNLVTSMVPGNPMLIDPTIINITGNWTINNSTVVNLVNSIVNIGENLILKGGATLNMSGGSIINVTGNISLEGGNTSWLNLTGNDFVEYCYYSLEGAYHDVGGTVHLSPTPYNNFNSHCFGINVTEPEQSVVYTANPMLFRIVLFGNNATLGTPPAMGELFRLGNPGWVVQDFNFSMSWVKWIDFDSMSPGWFKFTGASNFTTPGSIPLHVQYDGNDSHHRAIVTFYWNGTAVAPTNGTTVTVDVNINETLVDSAFASGILMALIAVAAIFAFLFANTAGTVLESMYLLLVHFTLLIVGAVMLKIGAYFISAELLASVMPFYTMVMFIMVLVTFYVLLQFLINTIKSINGKKST
jgi:hypothetical protein